MILPQLSRRDELKPYPRNARTHRVSSQANRCRYQEFVHKPVLIDEHDQIIAVTAGRSRQAVGPSAVPTLQLSHLSPTKSGL